MVFFNLSWKENLTQRVQCLCWQKFKDELSQNWKFLVQCAWPPKVQERKMYLSLLLGKWRPLKTKHLTSNYLQTLISIYHMPVKRRSRCWLLPHPDGIWFNFVIIIKIFARQRKRKNSEDLTRRVEQDNYCMAVHKSQTWALTGSQIIWSVAVETDLG